MKLPGPMELIGIPLRGVAAIEVVLGLVPKLSGLLDQVAGLVTRVQQLVSDIEATHERVRGVVDRAEAATASADAVIRHAESATARADLVIDRAGALTAQVEPLLAGLSPALTDLQPMLTRLAETTSPGEVDAAVALVDTLPDLVQRMHRDILPVLDTLGSVAPDLHELLEVSRQLNEILGSVPGLGRAKKRVEEGHEDDRNEATG